MDHNRDPDETLAEEIAAAAFVLIVGTAVAVFVVYTSVSYLLK